MLAGLLFQGAAHANEPDRYPGAVGLVLLYRPYSRRIDYPASVCLKPKTAIASDVKSFQLTAGVRPNQSSGMRIATDTKTRIRTESALPGNEIFRPETNGPKRRSRHGARETKPTRRTHADLGLIAGFREISVRTRMRGGLRGLELRAKHAVAIEPVSRE